VRNRIKLQNAIRFSLFKKSDKRELYKEKNAHFISEFFYILFYYERVINIGSEIPYRTLLKMESSNCTLHCETLRCAEFVSMCEVEILYLAADHFSNNLKCTYANFLRFRGGTRNQV